MTRCGNSRLFFYKVYKIMCKMLEVECILYGRMIKRDKIDTIFGIDYRGLRFPLFGSNAIAHTSSHGDPPKWTRLSIDKRCKTVDIQKAIVKRVMKAVEVGDVWIEPGGAWDHPTILKGTCWEQHVIDMDLKNEH